MINQKNKTTTTTKTSVKNVILKNKIYDTNFL